MTIKTAWSAQNLRVGRVSGNTAIFFSALKYGLTYRCHSEGGLLAILTTQQKQEDIAQFLSSERSCKCYMVLSCLYIFQMYCFITYAEQRQSSESTFRFVSDLVKFKTGFLAHLSC